MLVPHPRRIQAQRELAPGCAREVLVDIHSMDRHAVCVPIYLPPDSRRDTLVALEGVPRPSDGDVCAGGDINLQVHAPRGEQEHEGSESLLRLLGSWGACPLVSGRPTRRVDMQWHLGLSEHAVCCSSRATTERTAQHVCTPAGAKAATH